MSNRDLTECGATSPCSEADHYASTHDECDHVLVGVVFDGLLSLCALLETTKDDGNFIENGFASGWERYDPIGEEGESVNTDFIDCPEVAGKTIQLLRIHRDLSIASLATGGYAKLR
jgi:hypothetical protein